MVKPEFRGERRGFGPAFFCGLLALSSNAMAGSELFGRMTVSAVSEPEPIETTLNDWGAEFDGGERQWVLGHAETGVRLSSGLEVSFFSRALADLRMNRSAVDFYGRISRKESLEAGRTVPVSVEVNGFSGHGLRLGYRHESSQWTLTGGLSLFRTSHLMTGTLDGAFSATDDSDFTFDAEVDYLYFRDVIFERPEVKEANGLGWGVDAALVWQPDNHWTFSGRVEDLFARIRWKDAPYTEAVASTDQKSLDEDGYAEFAPLLSGREGYRSSFLQDLEARYYGSAEYRLGEWLFSARGQYQFGYGYAGLGVGYQFGNQCSLEAVYWPEHETMGMAFQGGKWALNISLDHPRWREVQALAVGLSYGY